MTERLVTDLPLPDSPTSARVEPRSIVKLTSLTALTTPARVKKCVLRFLTSRILSLIILIGFISSFRFAQNGLQIGISEQFSVGDDSLDFLRVANLLQRVGIK